MTITNAEITKKLHEYYDARTRLRDCRVELMKIAVDLGADQEILQRGTPSDFLDGYLVGQGILPTYRKVAA